MIYDKKIIKILATAVVMGGLLVGCKSAVQEPNEEAPTVVEEENKEAEKEVTSKEENKKAEKEVTPKEENNEAKPQDMAGHLSLFFGAVEGDDETNEFTITRSQFTEKKLVSFVNEYVARHLDNGLPLVKNYFSLNFGDGTRYLVENISKEGASVVVESNYGIEKRGWLLGDSQHINWEHPLEIPTLEYFHELEEWAEANNVNLMVLDDEGMVVSINSAALYHYEIARENNLFPGMPLYVHVTEVTAQ